MVRHETWIEWQSLICVIFFGAHDHCWQDDKCVAMWKNMIHHPISCISNHNAIAKMIEIHTHMVDGYIFHYEIHHP